MTIGASIFLIAVGAILKYAVTATVAGVDIQTVGLILMIAGAIGLVIGLFIMFSDRGRTDGAAYDDRGPARALLLGRRADDPVVAEAADLGRRRGLEALLEDPAGDLCDGGLHALELLL